MNLSNIPPWAIGVAEIKYRGGTDLRPYYFIGEDDQYQRCTAKNTIHKFGGSNQDIDNMSIIVGNMPVDILPNNLCFGARWISPVTNKPVTALHFSSFIDCMRELYNRPLYRS